MDKIIGFIGTGNMGSALVKAVSKSYSPKNIYLSNKPEDLAVNLANEIGATFSSNEEIAKKANYIFLGVKPQMMKELLDSVKDIFAKRQDRFILVTMAAGVTLKSISDMAGGDYPVIRIMPNTPVMIGKGMVIVTKNDIVTDDELKFFYDIMSASGELDYIKEDLIDMGCAVSGCGPAFLYMFAENLAKGGEKCGLSYEKALKYATETIIGAAGMIKETGISPEELKQNVMSPGGSTVEGVKALVDGGFNETVMEAVIKAYNRTKELGRNK